MKSKLVIFTLYFLIVSSNINAQYFGRNKPGYKQFNYKVYSTPNFEIYHYLENDSILYEIASRSEQWYRLHQIFFKDTLDFKNPILLYNNHGDFQQTNVSGDIIGVGTGGFTEGLKNRVVIPISQTDDQTDHVLGHELVHAFQYNYLLGKAGMSITDLGNIPLWMIEGMAEYLSVGSVDLNTAMWLRDDIVNNSLPTLKEMTYNPKYNPYRYGQAFWAFVSKTYGDEYFAPLLALTAKVGYVKAIETKLAVKAEPEKDSKKKHKKNKNHSKKKKAITPTGVKMVNFDSLWHSSIKEQYLPLMKDTIDSMVGIEFLNSKNAGYYNFSPVLSPDGRYMIFMSEKELYSIELFLVDMKTGRIKGRFNKRVNENEIDAFNFIESAGTWSPDSKYFAYVVYKKGKNALLIINAKNKKVEQEVEFPDIDAFSNPSWSPDGGNIVFSAQKEGKTDIFMYNLKSGSLDNITKNGKSNIHPSWSYDGKKIVFSTSGNDTPVNSGYLSFCMNLAIYNVGSKETHILDVFKGANNVNPLFSPEDRSIYFLSDRDGFRNLYRYSLNDDKVYQQTGFLTGITGMTSLSPAISIAKDSTIAYSYYSKRHFSIYKARLSEFREKETDKHALNYEAATLPPFKNIAGNRVDSLLAKRLVKGPEKSKVDFKELPFRPKFQLDYISNINVGVSTGLISPGAAGGVSALFSDIVGNNQMYLNLNINGEIYDFGGAVALINQEKRFKYGISVSHIPYITGYQGYVMDSILINNENIEVLNDYFDLYRIFESRIVLFGYYPVSSTMRFEAALSATRYGYRLERHNRYYDTANYNNFYGYKKEVLDGPEPAGYFGTDLAYVIDNSYFGLTSPLRGTRGRFQISKNFGYYNYFTTLFDLRKYFYTKPVTFAFRLYNQNRIGNDADKNDYNKLYIGYPWYIRGYESASFNRQRESEEELLSINQLLGSKMVVTNFEIRLPFTGPEKLSLIKSRVFFTDLNVFFDAGLIWDNSSKIDLTWDFAGPDKRIPLTSAGISLRFNLFGYIILEPYYAIPFQVSDKPVFGLNFMPGW